MTRPYILVAGVGNIFLGDDAFGSEVARRLAERTPPDEARVVDFGVRGFDLACALMDGYEVTILVDATPRGGAPGTLYVIEPDLSELDASNSEEMMIDTHGMNPMKALGLAKAMGGEFKRILLVGCEPATIDADEERMGLSEAVLAAVDEAVALVESLISEIIGSRIHCLRDPTRGGVATTLNEIALGSDVCVQLDEARIPAQEEVKAEPRGMVVLETVFGGTRIVDMLVGEQTPRIC